MQVRPGLEAFARPPRELPIQTDTGDALIELSPPPNPRRERAIGQRNSCLFSILSLPSSLLVFVGVACGLSVKCAVLLGMLSLVGALVLAWIVSPRSEPHERSVLWVSRTDLRLVTQLGERVIRQEQVLLRDICEIAVEDGRIIPQGLEAPTEPATESLRPVVVARIAGRDPLRISMAGHSHETATWLAAALTWMSDSARA